MDAASFARMEAVFHAALGRPAPERAAFVAAECGTDAELRAAVERLLAADSRAPDRIERFTPFAAETVDPYLERVLGPWRLVERLATGGMGVVYRGVRTDGMFEQTVAVKLLRFEAASTDTLRRFDAERRTLARLEHPNFARLLDGGATAGGTPYLVMEYLDGLPIDRYCAERRSTLSERLELFAVVCRAVQFAHGNLVIHRDLKPGNIFVDRQGTPKLLDFGIAALLEEGEAEARTQLQIFTPDYASPEQLRGEPLTTASDIWSLGVVLYELVTGQRPWLREGMSPGEWERVVSERRPTRPSTVVAATLDPERCTHDFGLSPARLRRRLRGDLDRIVLKALQADPGRRYDSAQQLAEDLERFATGHPVLARDDSLAYRLVCFAARNRLAVAAGLAVAIALAVALAATWRGQRRAEQALGVATIAQHRAEAAADHGRIEAESFRLIADFLGESFMSTTLDDTDRTRFRASVLRHAEQVRRQHRDQPHLRANLIDALGGICTRLGLLDDAKPLLAEAYQLRLRVFGEHSLETAMSLTNLGRLGFAVGELEEANELLRHSLRLQRELPADIHTDVATAANDLAAAARRLGDLSHARQLHEEALAIRLATVGEDTLPVAESQHNLAHVLLDLGEAEVARELARKALAIRRTALGEDHKLALQTAITLAAAELQRGEHKAAEELLREAERGYRALGVEGQEGLFHTVSNLGALRMTAKDPAGAAPLADEALALARERHQGDHLDVATAWTRIASVASARDDPERAQHAWQEALRIRRARLPRGHRLVAMSLLGLATVRLQSGQAETADPELREALTIGEALEPGDPDLVARIQLGLGTCAAALGRGDESRRLLERALETFRELHGEEAPTTREVRSRIERLH